MIPTPIPRKRRTLPWAVPFGMGLLAVVAWLVLWSPSRVAVQLEAEFETELGPGVQLDKPNAKQRQQLIDQGKRADLWARILVCDAAGQPIQGARLLVADSFRDAPSFIEARGPVLEILSNPKERLRIVAAPGYGLAQLREIGKGDWACLLKPVQTVTVEMQAAVDAADPVRVRRLESEAYHDWLGWLDPANGWVEFDQAGKVRFAVPGANVELLNLGLELVTQDNRRWLIPNRPLRAMRNLGDAKVASAQSNWGWSNPPSTHPLKKPAIDTRKADWIPFVNIELRPPFLEFAAESILTVRWDGNPDPVELSIRDGQVLNPFYFFAPNTGGVRVFDIELSRQVGQRVHLASTRGRLEKGERGRRLVMGVSEKAVEVLGARPEDYAVALVPWGVNQSQKSDIDSYESCDVPASGRVLVQDFATLEPMGALLVHKAAQRVVAVGEWNAGEATLQLIGGPLYGVKFVGGEERSGWEVALALERPLSVEHTSTEKRHASGKSSATFSGPRWVSATQDETVYLSAGIYKATLIENEVRFPMPDLRVGDVDPTRAPELLEVDVQLPELISTKGFVRSSVGVPTASVVLLLHFESGQRLEAMVFGEGAFAAPQYPSNRITRIEYVPDSMANRYSRFPVVEVERQDASGTYAVIR